MVFLTFYIARMRESCGLAKKKNWRFGIFLMADDACVCARGFKCFREGEICRCTDVVRMPRVLYLEVGNGIFCGNAGAGHVRLR